MTKEEKEVLKKKYIKKFKEIYKILPDTSKVNDMIDRLALQAVIIDECEEHIAIEGVVTSMSQGSYSIDRENPYSKVLDRTVKTYQSLIRQLDDMRPSSKETSVARAGENLMKFIAKGSD